MLKTNLFLQIYTLVVSGILGACMGSFLGCMAWRIVHHESFLKGRSHCDHCGHVLSVRDLVPVFSYLFSKGRCRYCGKKLTASYVWGELASAAVFVSIVLKYDVSLQTLEYLLWASLLLACSFADLEGYIIPDGFLIASAVVRLIFIFLSGNILRELLLSLLGGAAVAGALLLIVILFEKIAKKEAMGGGDIKLIFVTGLYLGWKKNILCLLLSCVVGILFAVLTQKSREKRADSRVFPFGPSIAVAAWLCLLFGDTVLNAYLSLF